MPKNKKIKRCEICGKVMFYIRSSKRYCGDSHKKGGCAYLVSLLRHKKYYNEIESYRENDARRRKKNWPIWYAKNRAKFNKYMRERYHSITNKTKKR